MAHRLAGLLLACVLVAVTAAAAPARAGEAASPAAGAAPVVELYTVGASEHLFSRFGHAAICTIDEVYPRGRCFNYGTGDFSRPVKLFADFVRGRADLWVAEADLPKMVDAYRREDRTVWRQRLPLSPEQARSVAAALEASTAPEVRHYRYHHFHDNCTTRIRDVLDGALGGALRAAGTTPDGPTFRELSLEGFAGDVWLLAGTELLLGTPADVPTSPWDRMFLPDGLRELVAARLSAPAEVVYRRRAGGPGGSPYAGRLALLGAGAVLGALVLAAARVGPRAARWAGHATALLLGSAGLALVVLALASTFQELSRNLVMLVLVPTDLALPLLAGVWRRRYLDVRLAGIVACAVASTAGLLSQPLGAAAALALLPLLALRVAVRRVDPL